METIGEQYRLIKAGKVCAVCGVSMYRRWAGASIGRRRMCLECNRKGWYFRDDGTVANQPR